MKKKIIGKERTLDFEKDPEVGVGM